jgi:sugar/nucleoside kinase (ribokinase family)
MGPDGVFVLPAYPTEEVRDPTGAGDSFAGGLVGFAASRGKISTDSLRRALAYGTVVASFTIEDFGTTRLAQITREDIEERLRQFVGMTHLTLP